ncbi:MAG: tripartite tricarboxylate transporter permease [Candidatus Micrarchaeia archaeon]
MIWPLAALVAGMLLGIFSGLMPGIHSNTVASVISEMPIAPEMALYLIVALLAAHLVFQFIPSIFLSIPDDTVVASVLPGHRMALEGRGREALTVCVFSLAVAAFASALLLPLALIFVPAIYSFIEPHVAPILVVASAFLLASEKKAGKIAIASFVFLLSGALGIASLRGAINDPLFPSFCGLFAASGILLSFTSQQKLPEQKGEKTRLDFLPYVAAGIIFGGLSDLLPGIAAPAQIAVFASALFSMDDARKFLALVSSIAVSHMVFAFGALVSIGKAREGALAIANQLKPIVPGDLPVLLGIFLLSLGICALLAMFLSRHVKVFSEIDMKALNLGILGYLVVMVGIISGAGGLLLFATSTAVGLLPPLLGVRRTHVMGLIIVPSILLAL